ncbi:FUSC family protein, partial [Jatrophihabitans sp. YIM 134969]
PGAHACRLLAARLRVGVDAATGALTELSVREAADAAARDAVAALRRNFYATPNRPTGLSTPARALVRLVDELGWFTGVLDQADGTRLAPLRPEVAEVHLGVADVLDRCADLLDTHSGDPTALHAALDVVAGRLAHMEVTAVGTLSDPTMAPEEVGALEPSFRAQEMVFATREIAANTERAARAEQRTWWERLSGRQPEGVGGPGAAAWERANAHLDLRSVWLHNSVRGAAGLGVAVLVADLTGVQHSFWVVLGTLSVLRSNALSTGQNALRGLAGTAVGIVVGGLIVWAAGTNRPLLWVLLPLAVLLAGLAPAAVSFLAGQAAFTVTLVILFNIIAPVGYEVGLVRVEDVALGCGVSVLVGLLFWPRGATSVLGRALGDAYESALDYLAHAVAFGARRCERGLPELPAPTTQAETAAAASRRLDDAFREYLAERGGKKLHLAEVTSLVTGTIAPRLAADAVLDLWSREDGSTTGDRTAAGREVGAGARHLQSWYHDFAAALRGEAGVPAPLPPDPDVHGRLLDAVRRDLAGRDGFGTPTAVRMVWTGDHLDAVRRQQDGLIDPAVAIARPEPAPAAQPAEGVPA